MLVLKPASIPPSEITPREIYLNRRELLRAAAMAGSLTVAGPALAASLPDGRRARLEAISKSHYSTDEAINSYADITTYNNYYEFGTAKEDPQRNAQDFEPRPWTIKVSGHAEQTGIFDLEDFVKPYALEERVYRLRCVERWSMVIPWVGIPLVDIVRQLKPLSKARYLAFETLLDPEQMPGQRSQVLRWPYVEGLTIAEATNPLTLMAVGVYGEVLPNQNGAPIRLVVPWKYGFKSIKSIVSMHFSEMRPRGSWELAAPNEYGFYANVNPKVDHPRWSQARERRIGASAATGLRSLLGASDMQETLLFNGYGEQVAYLYESLDLRRNF